MLSEGRKIRRLLATDGQAQRDRRLSVRLPAHYLRIGRNKTEGNRLVRVVPLSHFRPPLARLEHLLNSAQGLPRALFVFDEREAYVVISMITEPNAWAHRDLGVNEQFLRKLHRPRGTVLLRDTRPHKHRRLRKIYRPSELIESRNQHIAARLVDVADLCNTVCGPSNAAIDAICIGVNIP